MYVQYGIFIFTTDQAQINSGSQFVYAEYEMPCSYIIFNTYTDGYLKVHWVTAASFNSLLDGSRSSPQPSTE